MGNKFKSIEKLSYFFSWFWVSDDFKEQFATLRGNVSADAAAGETIWKTRFKDVQLLDMPASDGEGFRIAFKSYREKRFFRYFFRPSLAAREAIGFEVVKDVGIPVVKVLAYGERRFLGHLIDAFFITRYEENTETLLFFKENPSEHEMLLSLLKENIKYLAKLHLQGFIHGGAHPRNILWRKQDDGNIESIWLDLASLRSAGKGKNYWKYILTDLSDFTEAFKLTQDELDMIMAEYKSINPLPVSYKLRTDHERKFSYAVRSE